MRRSLIALALFALVLVGVHTTMPTVLAWCGPGFPHECKAGEQPAPNPVPIVFMGLFDAARVLFPSL